MVRIARTIITIVTIATKKYETLISNMFSTITIAITAIIMIIVMAGY